MKVLSSILLVLTMLIGTSAFAQGKDGLGVGVIIGEPTGLSVKKWIEHDRALDLGVAWSFAENDSLHIHADYLFHRFDIFSNSELDGKTPLYFGIGARVKLENDDDIHGKNHHDSLVGVRVPFGVSYLFADSPVDLFVEIVPIIDVVPSTELELNAAIGARFYF